MNISPKTRRVIAGTTIVIIILAIAGGIFVWDKFFREEPQVFENEAEQFKYIYRYSPYHNVKAGTNYPAVLLVTGDSDTRVAPLHARKMTALLQASTGSDRPVLLHYDTKAGHSAGRSITKVIEDLTDEFSFLFWQLDVGSSGQKAAGK